jgi:hypothetical protein
MLTSSEAKQFRLSVPYGICSVKHLLAKKKLNSVRIKYEKDDVCSVCSLSMDSWTEQQCQCKEQFPWIDFRTDPFLDANSIIMAENPHSLLKNEDLFFNKEQGAFNVIARSYEKMDWPEDQSDIKQFNMLKKSLDKIKPTEKVEVLEESYVESLSSEETNEEGEKEVYEVSRAYVGDEMFINFSDGSKKIIQVAVSPQLSPRYGPKEADPVAQLPSENVNSTIRPIKLSRKEKELFVQTKRYLQEHRMILIDEYEIAHGKEQQTEKVYCLGIDNFVLFSWLTKRKFEFFCTKVDPNLRSKLTTMEKNNNMYVERKKPNKRFEDKSIITGDAKISKKMGCDYKNILTCPSCALSKEGRWCLCGRDKLKETKKTSKVIDGSDEEESDYMPKQEYVKKGCKHASNCPMKFNKMVFTGECNLTCGGKNCKHIHNCALSDKLCTHMYCSLINDSQASFVSPCERCDSHSCAHSKICDQHFQSQPETLGLKQKEQSMSAMNKKKENLNQTKPRETSETISTTSTTTTTTTSQQMAVGGTGVSQQSSTTTQIQPTEQSLFQGQTLKSEKNTKSTKKNLEKVSPQLRKQLGKLKSETKNKKSKVQKKSSEASSSGSGSDSDDIVNTPGPLFNEVIKNISVAKTEQQTGEVIKAQNFSYDTEEKRIIYGSGLRNFCALALIRAVELMYGASIIYDASEFSSYYDKLREINNTKSWFFFRWFRPPVAQNPQSRIMQYLGNLPPVVFLLKMGGYLNYYFTYPSTYVFLIGSMIAAWIKPLFYKGMEPAYKLLSSSYSNSKPIDLSFDITFGEVIHKPLGDERCDQNRLGEMRYGNPQYCKVEVERKYLSFEDYYILPTVKSETRKLTVSLSLLNQLASLKTMQREGCPISVPLKNMENTLKNLSSVNIHQSSLAEGHYIQSDTHELAIHKLRCLRNGQAIPTLENG